MCGIAGILSKDGKDVREDVIRRMAAAISHRGPDDQGWESLPAEGVALAHTRLSILDLSAAGHQPMWNDARSAVVTFNGEIYNFRELRKELEAKGYAFKSNCDTEVLVKGYEAWGRKLVDRLNGMFAFAIWDRKLKSLWLVRDRMGVKPLYYHYNPGMRLFIFASEIKSMLSHPAVRRRVDPDGLRSYLSLGYVVSPLTMFEGIQKLPSAHSLVVGPDQEPEIHRYWDVPDISGNTHQSERQMEEEIRELFSAAVERRLISDVSLGAFLSGGVDSSLVVAVMCKLMKEPVRTFSAAFDIGPRSIKYNVDADSADSVSKIFGTRHTRLVIPMQSGLMDSIRRTVRCLDEPHGNPTTVSTLLLSEKVKQEGVSVVLTGDGSDEVWGGYARYQADLQTTILRSVPGMLRRMVPTEMMGGSRLTRKLGAALTKAELAPLTPKRLMSWWWVFDPVLQERILVPGLLRNGNPAETAMQEVLERLPQNRKMSNQDAMLYADLNLWIAEESNMRMDKTTMAVALETRAPFLDFPLVEYGMSIPFSRKAGLGKGKRLLKTAFKDLLPAEVVSRPKWGWFSPVHYWVKDCIWTEASSAIASLQDTGLFREAVTQITANRDKSNPMQVWMLLMFALWHKEYME